MDNIKIGSIVRFNAQGMVYSNLNGLVYDLRLVGGQRHPIATVAFEYESRTREISTEFLTPIGEIEPECTALNYRPGTRPKLRENYIVDHIEIGPESYQFDQNPVFYKVIVIVTLDNNTLKNMCSLSADDISGNLYNNTLKNVCRTFADDIASNLKGENNMCMDKKKDTRVPTNPIEKIIFNDPATIVFWKDGTKTIVKCQEGATFDPEKGLAMAISRHYLCDVCGLERYDGVFKRYVPKEEKK